MPSKDYWLEPDLIYCLHHSGRLVHEDIVESLESMLQRLNESAHRIHMLVDIREVTGFSVGQIQTLPQLRHLIRHPKMGWIAVVGRTGGLSFWLKLMTKLVGLRYANFETSQDAIEFLREVHRIHVARA